MTQVTTYKCPNCGADIPYDATVGELKCQHCGVSYEIDKLEQFNVEKDVKTDSFSWQENVGGTTDTEGRITYTCPSCGGAVTADENMASATCPYCGSAVVVGEQLSGMLEPNLIIPFKLTKEQAKQAYYNFIKKKLFLPNDFKKLNFIEKLNGIYVPYWLFHCDCNGQARFRATRIHTSYQGDYEITTTDHYLVYRDGQARFDYVPVDASTKLDDGLLDALEPYDLKEATDFKTAYLSGFFTDKYDQDENETAEKANYRIKNSMEQILASSVGGYSTVRTESCSVQFANGVADYALYPVYIFSTNYKGKFYQFAMNGQTGKFSGELPVDKNKVKGYCTLVFVITFILWFGITFFTMMKGGM